MNIKKVFYVSLKGERWKIMLYTARGYEKEVCDWSVGVTSRQYGNSIEFKGPRVSKDTIAHELTHALLGYRHYQGKSYGHIEEQVCEEMGKSFKKLYLLTNYIYAKLNKGAI